MKKITTRKSPQTNPLLDQYLKTKVRTKFNNNFNKNTLMMLAPFAASALISNQISAQCGTPPVGVFSINSIPDIDVDGDGDIDFAFSGLANGSSYNNLISGVGGAMVQAATSTFFGSNPSYIGAYSSGAIVTNLPTPVAVGNMMILYSGTSLGYFTPGTSGYAIVTDNDGDLGWVEISVTGTAAAPLFEIVSLGAEDPAGGGTDGVGTITISDCGTLLPVEFVSFEARIIDRSISLVWETASEINNLGFEIQRSRDGENFQKVGFVEGVGNSARNEQYSFIDKNTKSNVEYYYRLKQIDFDGNSEFSSIIKETVTDASKIAVGDFAPNPSISQVSLEIISGKNSNSSIVLFDNSGIVVLENSNQLNKGRNIINLDVSNLAGGSYFAKVIVGEEVSYKKIMVIK